ncbi:hypothetical protein [Micromonospora sp. CPCC 206061]|uniref:hypothetical protein n=1 Tax=Micromonospora sp. CPCC 206061 TaxID=3122410 RepID=UPI002FF2FA5C
MSRGSADLPVLIARDLAVWRPLFLRRSLNLRLCNCQVLPWLVFTFVVYGWLRGRPPTWFNVLSMVLQEAVEYQRIPFNPCRGVRVNQGVRAELPHAATGQVTAIAARLTRPSDQLMVMTAAYTGMRWGELAGLARDNLDLVNADIYVHPEVGALHEDLIGKAVGHRHRNPLMHRRIDLWWALPKQPPAAYQRAVRHVRRQIEMQMRDAVAKHVHVNLVGRCRRAKRSRRPGQNRTQRRCLDSIEVGDEGDVAMRLEVREAEDRAMQNDRHPPVIVLPHPLPAKERIGLFHPAQQAPSRGHRSIMRALLA